MVYRESHAGHEEIDDGKYRFCLLIFLNLPTNTPLVFHVETTWKGPFPRRFNVEYTYQRGIHLVFVGIAQISLMSDWRLGNNPSLSLKSLT